MTDLLRLLALFATIVGALWLLHYALARLVDALLPRLIASREALDEVLVEESPLYARVTRSRWFLVALGALAALAVWRAGQLERGILGFAGLAAVAAIDARWPGRAAISVTALRGAVAAGALAYLG